MQLPKDPAILLSFLNTQLRDFYPSLGAFCEDNALDEEELRAKLLKIGYVYDEKQNRFR